MGRAKLAVMILRHSHPELDLVSSLPLFCDILYSRLFIRRWIPSRSQTESEAFIFKSDFSIWNTVTSDLLLRLIYSIWIDTKIFDFKFLNDICP